MKFACYIKKEALRNDASVLALVRKLQASGHTLYDVASGLQDGTDMLLCFGGDGTFLTAATLAAPLGIPLLGVNLGRLGFLSEYTPDEVASALASSAFHIEERHMLEVSVEGAGTPDGFLPYALNEAGVHRLGSGTLGIDVCLGAERALPTYWADGLLVSTSSGSTAYSLSAGGPICTPDLGACIITPVAPHNLNVRPLLVPEDTRVSIGIHDRSRGSSAVLLSLDNRDYRLPNSATVVVAPAPFALRRVVLGKTDFIRALRTKLLWGEDVRNS
ncbi:MAG: NAD(+)/NADH kinase [Bacteroidales bacterium]|nr:NAD(+)/NADH kinase [Candidatus Cryptobacteroides aphodequi]